MKIDGTESIGHNVYVMVPCRWLTLFFSVPLALPLFPSLSSVCLGGANYWAPAFGLRTCVDGPHLPLISSCFPRPAI